MIWKQSHKADLWGGQRTNRFAPVLAPLRCARPVGRRQRIDYKVAPMEGPRLKSVMKDFQLYQQILGLVEPWVVESVTLKPKEQEIEVRVGFADRLWGCPLCQKRMHIHDYEERRWRHLDSCQFKTIIVSRVPVVRCAEHGAQTVAVPWAEKYTRFSRLFERLAIDVMLECSITGACSILGMSWDEADGIK